MRLTPSAIGTPLGAAQSAAIGPGGGTLISLDGRATLTVPPGAVAAPVIFAVQEITNTAPGGVGSAYRFDPQDVSFPELTLTFTPGTPTVADLTVAAQSGASFWLRYRDVARDLTAGALTVATTHLGDFAAVRSNTSSDLRGRFTLTSAKDIAFTAIGDTTLNYGGDDSQGAHYLQWGTLTLQAPVAIGSATCSPTAATWQLYANIADLRLSPAKFDWGVSGVWELTCSDATVTSLGTAFDTYGVNDIGCARGWVGVPVISLAQVKGTYRVDCGALGTAIAELDFQNCVAGAACTSTNPCHTASISCAGTYPACVDDGNQPDGTPCPGGVCGGGMCNVLPPP